MAANFTLSIMEIILLLCGAILLGITIHFFISSRKNLLENSSSELEKANKARDEWKLRYFNDMEARDKEFLQLKDKLQEAEENADIYSIEADEMRKQNKRLQAEMNSAPPRSAVQEEKPDYLEQLRLAQSGLLEHNEKINQLLGNIDIIKEKEEQQREIIHSNEILSDEIHELKARISEKEREINQIQQKEHLTKEMTSMLDSAYNEFDVLQSKIQKLENQVNISKSNSMDYEELKEQHVKVSRDYEDQKQKLHAMAVENKELQLQLNENLELLQEATQQRQHLQKRVNYLEELNSDLHVVSDVNKKLEGQIKRLGELESMLNMVSEERDQLARRQNNI